jgi:hypothetical protein
MKRRHFMGSLMAGGLATAGAGIADAAAAASAAPAAGNDRAYMVGLLQKMAEPVLTNMARGELHKNFALELSPTWDGRDPKVAYLECFGRLIAGLAPWLALPDDATPEGRTRARLRQLALQSYVHAVDPGSPDYLAWRGHGQALVDSAYFTNALMRAPKALWDPLDATTKQRIVAEIKQLRRIEPPYINWMLFAAMNEAFLLSIGEEADPMRTNVAVRKINEWYVGDGWIKDGDAFHFDYYSAFVMQPMMLEILEVLEQHKAPFWNGKPAELRAQALRRMQRYSEHLERFISPTGTYPPIGRSLTYRTAAFQPLALLAWRKQLPAAACARPACRKGRCGRRCRPCTRRCGASRVTSRRMVISPSALSGTSRPWATGIPTTAACTSRPKVSWRWGCRPRIRTGPVRRRTGPRKRRLPGRPSRRIIRSITEQAPESRSSNMPTARASPVSNTAHGRLRWRRGRAVTRRIAASTPAP